MSITIYGRTILWWWEFFKILFELLNRAFAFQTYTSYRHISPYFRVRTTRLLKHEWYFVNPDILCFYNLPLYSDRSLNGWGIMIMREVCRRITERYNGWIIHERDLPSWMCVKHLRILRNAIFPVNGWRRLSRYVLKTINQYHHFTFESSKIRTRTRTGLFLIGFSPNVYSYNRIFGSAFEQDPKIRRRRRTKKKKTHSFSDFL